MKYVNAILTALVAVVVGVGASANVYVPVKDTGFDIEIRKLHILQNSIETDTIGFVLKNPNVCIPQYIGRCGGRVVSSVYDSDCCMELFSVGNEPLLYECLSLAFKEDSVANRAVFYRANKRVDIDFNQADAIDRIVRLVVPRKGWKREGYTYVCGGDPQYGFVMRSTFVAELPNALADRRRMLDAITMHMPDNDTIFETECNYDFPDTVYYVSPKPEINNMYDYVYAEAQFTRFNDPMYFEPLSADSTAERFYRIIRTVEYIPVLFTDTLMTIYKYDDRRSPAGSGGVMQKSYTTYVTRGDKTVRLTSDDIFRTDKSNEIKKVFIEWLAKDLADASEPYADEYEGFDAYYLYYQLVSDERAFNCEADEHGYERSIDYVHEKMRNNDYSSIRMPDVALLPDGVMFMYEMCWLTGVGENGLTTLFVPYEALKGCFRPGVLPK